MEIGLESCRGINRQVLAGRLSKVEVRPFAKKKQAFLICYFEGLYRPNPTFQEESKHISVFGVKNFINTRSFADFLKKIDFFGCQRKSCNIWKNQSVDKLSTTMAYQMSQLWPKWILLARENFNLQLLSFDMSVSMYKSWNLSSFLNFPQTCCPGYIHFWASFLFLPSNLIVA